MGSQVLLKLRSMAILNIPITLADKIELTIAEGYTRHPMLNKISIEAQTKLVTLPFAIVDTMRSEAREQPGVNASLLHPHHSQ